MTAVLEGNQVNVPSHLLCLACSVLVINHLTRRSQMSPLPVCQFYSIFFLSISYTFFIPFSIQFAYRYRSSLILVDFKIQSIRFEMLIRQGTRRSSLELKQKAENIAEICRFHPIISRLGM